MNFINRIRIEMAKAGTNFEIYVEGQSMNPSILNEDIINIAYRDNYEVGDIIVFVYKNDIIVHRIVGIEDKMYYCKGDNSFRIEKITHEEILGEVSLVNGKACFKLSPILICMSLEIGFLLSKGMKIEEIKKTPLYEQYLNEIINQYEKYIGRKSDVNKGN